MPAHFLFGEWGTLEACSFLYQAPSYILDKLSLREEQRQELKSQYLRLSKRAREGQKKDVLWGKTNRIPTIEEYLIMCEEKCAALEYAIRVGAVVGNATKEQTETLITAGNMFATAFQLVDDLICLREGSDDFGSDILEGKKTLPVIFTTATPFRQALLTLLAEQPKGESLVKEAVAVLRESGGIGKTQHIAQELGDKASSLVKEIFPNTRYRKILFSIIHYGLQRTE